MLKASSSTAATCPHPDAAGRCAHAQLQFGPFVLHPQQRQLLNHGQPQTIGSRALEILLLLVENAGVVISKDTLLARVWPDSVVEEINLRVQMAALRRALGDHPDQPRYIASIPNRGYCFVGDVKVACVPAVVESAADEPYTVPGAWAQNSSIEGRDDVIALLVTQLPNQRFITLTGPGGIGKTTVACRVSEQLSYLYPDGVVMVDGYAVPQPSQLLPELARACGLTLADDDAALALDTLLTHLQSRRVLILLDNCEHLVDACAELTEPLLTGTTGVAILATSREALRAEGEHVLRLPPLPCPPPAPTLSITDLLRHAATRLFVTRAQARLPSLVLSTRERWLVSEICRRLDGIPLAIELAAARVESLGLMGIAAAMDDPFPILERRHPAHERHRNLQTTLDWSYGLLSPMERTCLQRLALFQQSFALNDCLAVLGCDLVGRDQITRTVTQLVAKSWLMLDVCETRERYRLLEVTRRYAIDKLRGVGTLTGTTLSHQA